MNMKKYGGANRLVISVAGAVLLAGLGIYFLTRSPLPTGAPTAEEVEFVQNAPCALKVRQDHKRILDRNTVTFARMACSPDFRSKVLALAEEGNRRAQFVAYVSYWKGYGFEKDWALGFPWLIELAKGGDSIARANLRTLCGKGGSESDALADKCEQVPQELLAR